MRLMMNSWLKDHYEFKEIQVNGRFGLFPRLNLISRLILDIRSFNPDIIHISGLQLQGFYSVLASRLAGYRNIILTIRGKSTDSLEISFVKKMMMGYIIEPITLFMSKYVTTVCIDMSNRIHGLKKSPKFAGVIHNAMPQLNQDNPDSHTIRTELGLNEKDLLLVYSGRIVMEKGISYLLEASRALKDSRIRLLLCGDGKDIDAYMKNYQPEIQAGKIFFLLRRKDIFAILKESDLFVFPTLHENLSNSLLEALAVGLPIIATNVGGNPEIVTDGVNGWLVPAKDSQALQEAIEKIIQDPELAKKMRKESLRIGTEHFSQRLVYQKIDELYQKSLR